MRLSSPEPLTQPPTHANTHKPLQSQSTPPGSPHPKNKYNLHMQACMSLLLLIAFLSARLHPPVRFVLQFPQLPFGVPLPFSGICHPFIIWYTSPSSRWMVQNSPPRGHSQPNSRQCKGFSQGGNPCGTTLDPSNQWGYHELACPLTYSLLNHSIHCIFPMLLCCMKSAPKGAARPLT